MTAVTKIAPAPLIDVRIDAFHTLRLRARPDFVHFTRRVNLSKLLAEGILGGGVMAVVPGCETCNACPYAYCIDIASVTHNFVTLPRDILAHPDDWRAVVFSSDHTLWRHCIEESRGAIAWPSDDPLPIPLIDPLVVTVDEAFDLLGTTLAEVAAARAAWRAQYEAAAV